MLDIRIIGCPSFSTLDKTVLQLIKIRNGRPKIIVVVKKTFLYPDVFFYNHLCPNPLFRNINMEKGIISVKGHLS